MIVRRLDQHRAIERTERPEDVTDFDSATARWLRGGGSPFGRVFDVANSLFGEIDDDDIGSHSGFSFRADAMMTPQPPRDEGDPGLRVSGRTMLRVQWRLHWRAGLPAHRRRSQMLSRAAAEIAG